MYIRTAALLFPLYALASLAMAAPGGTEARAECSSSTKLCCAQTFIADTAGVAAIKAILGVTVDPVIGPLLAISCTGFVGSCIGQTVCCQSGQSNNAVYVGCNNIAA